MVISTWRCQLPVCIDALCTYLLVCQGKWRLSGVNPLKIAYFWWSYLSDMLTWRWLPSKDLLGIPPPMNKPPLYPLNWFKTCYCYWIIWLFYVNLFICWVISKFYRELVSIMQSHDGGWWRICRGIFKTQILIVLPYVSAVTSLRGLMLFISM